MRVAVLGAGGAVGRACARALHGAGVSVLAVGRDRRRIAAALAGIDVDIQAGLDLDRVVAGDVTAVGGLTAGVDAVVGCAGPATRYARPLATAVLRAGVDYVDPGGTMALVHELGPLAVDHGARAVLGAGVQPGLTGLAADVALHRAGPAAVSMTGFCGGRQLLTPAGVAEYLDQAHAGSGRAGHQLVDGVRRAVAPADLPPPPPPFGERAMARAHLDQEVAAVAARRGVRRVLWCNVTDGEHPGLMLSRCLSGEAGPAEAVAAANAEVFGRRAYFHIVVTAQGSRGCGWARFSCADSYVASGVVAAEAVRAGGPPGAHWLGAAPDAVATWGALTHRMPAGAGVLADGIGRAGQAEPEEGEL